MSDETCEPSLKPRGWVKWIASLLVSLHFFAILTAVTSSSNGRFTSPFIAVKLNEPFRPYLDTLFLRNGYRFFAPNPGPNFVVWFRMTYEDGRVRWYEFPRRKDFATPLAYTRMLSMANMGSQTREHPTDPDRVQIIPGTKVCLSSFVRHVTSDRLIEEGLREAGTVQTVEIYRVGHLYIMPDQIREGWDYTDLRLYQPIYLGTFRPDGSLIDEDAAVFCLTQVLVTDMIQNDIAPVLLAEHVSGPEDYPGELETLGIPDPVRRLIEVRPEIVSLSSADVMQQVRLALGMDDESERDRGSSSIRSGSHLPSTSTD